MLCQQTLLYNEYDVIFTPERRIRQMIFEETVGENNF
jgi:hypothetical protein